MCFDRAFKSAGCLAGTWRGGDPRVFGKDFVRFTLEIRVRGAGSSMLT